MYRSIGQAARDALLTAITSSRTSVYPKYFGLKEPSFSIAPDPHYLFLSEQHKEALAHLLYGAGESGGFVLLTGEVGTGKTTVCRAFLEQLPEGVEVALILNPAVTANELLLNLCDEFRIPVPEGERSVKALVDRLNVYLLDAHGKGRRPVLIIDEAQSLRPKVLEQVRLLTNLETSKHKLLQIFLIGQPELRRLLERDALRQINQRVTARFHLRPFTLEETGDYIRHRVAVAGVDRPLFTAAAIRRIYHCSGGVPRLVNILCDRALLGACVTRGSQVTPAIVKRAAREVQGEAIDKPPRPAVRTGFAAAAAFVLAMIAGWLGYAWVSDDAAALLSDLLPGERSLFGAAPRSETAPMSEGPGEGSEDGDAPESPDSPLVASDGDPDATPVDSVGDGASGEAVQGEDGPVEGAPADSLPQIAPAGFEPDALAETLERIAMPEADALRLLLQRWGVEVESLPGADPCARVASLGLMCERGQGDLAVLRFFDRPALLRVREAGGARRFLVLSALDASFATLALPGGDELAPLDGLQTVWTGDYVLVWQPPPTGSALIGPGTSGESVRWLRDLLAKVPASGLPASDSSYYDIGLTRAVRAFQASRGLVADGIAGPRTLIQLHNAVDLPGVPRLVWISDAPESASTESMEP
ncbi:ExeA family protein [Thiocapsa marina]|uniref:Peptidoglycan-binding domain 1 protein n=1 Tax=Thiocapsa marina 5811 TaxID=768671 RepID=F9UIP4_9GAMM|nr:ExeA family protein [Thiocapsa marina]EGV15926.1 Peptidoglycan-binding domain 1 protein [Thiocapsa marina 5811]